MLPFIRIRNKERGVCLVGKMKSSSLDMIH